MIKSGLPRGSEDSATQHLAKLQNVNKSQQRCIKVEQLWQKLCVLLVAKLEKRDEEIGFVFLAC